MPRNQNLAEIRPGPFPAARNEKPSIFIKPGERRAAALKLRNLKQSDLAGELGITQTAVSKIINGSQYLDFDLAVRACEVLAISLDWLAYGLDPETGPPFYRNPERLRIEYLLSIIKEAEYPLVIVAMEEIIEVRLKDAPPDKPDIRRKRKKAQG